MAWLYEHVHSCPWPWYRGPSLYENLFISRARGGGRVWGLSINLQVIRFHRKPQMLVWCQHFALQNCCRKNSLHSEAIKVCSHEQTWCTLNGQHKFAFIHYIKCLGQCFQANTSHHQPHAPIWLKWGWIWGLIIWLSHWMWGLIMRLSHWTCCCHWQQQEEDRRVMTADTGTRTAASHKLAFGMRRRVVIQG